MGLETEDSLWGEKTPRKEVSVDGFGWMIPKSQIQSTSSLYPM